MLAIWSDVAPESETDYLHWLTREHAAERISTTGFLSVRVFRAMDFDIRRYFIVYDLENPSALSGEDYVQKLNHPTSWSQRIMPTLKNFVRGGGRVTTASGAGHGGFAAALALDDMQIVDAESLVPKLAMMDRICSACLLKVDTAKTSIANTREKFASRGPILRQSACIRWAGCGGGPIGAGHDQIPDQRTARCRTSSTSRSTSSIAGSWPAFSPRGFGSLSSEQDCK